MSTPSGLFASLKVIDEFKCEAEISYFEDMDVNNLITNGIIIEGVIETNSLELKDTGSNNVITLQAPTLSADYSLTFPIDDGTPGQVLSTDGSGILSWSTGGGGVAASPNDSIQFNAGSGTFGGSSNLLFDGANTLSINDTITGTADLTIDTSSQTGSTDSDSVTISTGTTVNGNAGNIILSPGTASGTGNDGVTSIDGEIQLTTDAFFTDLKVSNTSGLDDSRQIVHIETRDALSFPVPSFEPKDPNLTIAFDIAPSGEAGVDVFDFGTNGVAWMDICDNKVIGVNPVLSCLRLGNKEATLEIGSRAFNGGSTKNLHMTSGGTTTMILDTSNIVTVGTAKAPSSTSLSSRRLFVLGGLGTHGTVPSLILENVDSVTDKKVFELFNNADYIRNILWEDDLSTFYATISSTHNGTNGSTVISGDQSTLSTSDSSAVLECQSTTQGFLPPKMTTTQRDAITTPAEGLVIYNTTTQVLNFYNGTVWGAV